MKTGADSPSAARSDWGVTGIFVVAGVYFYFLIFAQFAFLHLAEKGAGGEVLRPVMAVMGGSGLLGSFLAPWLLRRLGPRRLARIALLVCAMVGWSATRAVGAGLFFAVAAGIGGALGMLTVTCAARLGTFFGTKRLGLKAGLATGLAYGVANLPVVFSASPASQAWMASAGCLVGGILLSLSRPERSEPASASPKPAPFPLGSGLAVFFALVWLDSAAFLVIQATPALNRWAWAGAIRQEENSLIHFAAAVLAGFLLDRGGWRVVVAGAFGSLAAGIGCLGSAAFHPLAPWFYAGGVSLYSTALLLFPSAGRGTNDPDARAAWTYALAGWIASALGIGMAQHLHGIPGWFLGAAGATVLWGVTPGEWLRRRERAVPLFGIVLLLALIYVEETMQTRPESAPEGIALGRQVYIAEGCMACHSQYVRPGSPDETLWGPATTASAAVSAAPPLIGNRRQGPDLQNIGNRRSIFWNRLHLEAPQVFSPGSPMPSYVSLFEGDGRRGEALLLYLQSLGAETVPQRREEIAAWRPKEGVMPVSSARAGELFEKNCAVCHGIEGRGNGPLASQVGGDEGPRDLVKAKWEFVAANDRVVGLARVVKFGAPGTSMPGHESFSDADVLALAAYVDALGAKAKNPHSPKP